MKMMKKADRQLYYALQHRGWTNAKKAHLAKAIKNGADVNFDYGGGDRPLHLAMQWVTYQGRSIKSKNHEALTMLLNAGADPNAVDKRGRTPLQLITIKEPMFSGYYMKAEMVLEFLKAGAWSSRLDNDGLTFWDSNPETKRFIKSFHTDLYSKSLPTRPLLSVAKKHRIEDWDILDALREEDDEVIHRRGDLAIVVRDRGDGVVGFSYYYPNNENGRHWSFCTRNIDRQLSKAAFCKIFDAFEAAWDANGNGNSVAEAVYSAWESIRAEWDDKNGDVEAA